MAKIASSLITGSALLLGSLAVNAAPIIIDNADIVAVSHDYLGNAVTQIDNSTAWGSRSLLAIDGMNSSATDLNYLDTGSGALLDFDINQTRDGRYRSYAYTYGSNVLFTATEDTSYSISGLYSANEVTSPGRVFSDVFLTNLTAGGTTLFRDYNYSDFTANESFTVGVFGEGDTGNSGIGSATGTLIAGNQYQFYFANYTRAVPTSDGGATATGCVTLSIGGATGAGSCGATPSVPEPMPLTLLGAGLALLGLRRKFLVKAV